MNSQYLDDEDDVYYSSAKQTYFNGKPINGNNQDCDNANSDNNTNVPYDKITNHKIDHFSNKSANKPKSSQEHPAKKSRSGGKSYSQAKRDELDYRTEYFKHNPGILGCIWRCAIT